MIPTINNDDNPHLRQELQRLDLLLADRIIMVRVWRNAHVLRHSFKNTLGKISESVSSPCATKRRSFWLRDPAGDKQRHG